jgi:uncharacterized protein (TIGR02271 family)
MTTSEAFVVVDREGQRGSAQLVNHDENQVLIRLDNGQAMQVDRTLLKAQADGSYTIPLRFADLSATRAEQHVIPVIEEAVRVDKQAVESGRVRLTKTVEKRDVLIDEPLMQEEVEVNRVVLNAMVDKAPPIRYEGDTMIIPVLEEVVVVEVKLMLREEIRVTRTRHEVHNPQTVTLRREDVVVARETETGSNGVDHA